MPNTNVTVCQKPFPPFQTSEEQDEREKQDRLEDETKRLEKGRRTRWKGAFKSQLFGGHCLFSYCFKPSGASPPDLTCSQVTPSSGPLPRITASSNRIATTVMLVVLKTRPPPPPPRPAP